MLSSLPLLGPNYITDTALLLIPEYLEKLRAKDAALTEKKTGLLTGRIDTLTLQDLAIKQLKAKIEALKAEHE